MSKSKPKPKPKPHSNKNDSDSDEEVYSAANKRKPKKKEPESESDSDKSESESESSDDEEQAEEFKKNVKDWVRLDNKQKQMQAENKAINKEKKTRSELILKYMVNHDLPSLNISDGKLKVNKSTTKTTLKQDYLETELGKRLGNKAKAEKWIQEIYDNRPEKVNVNLKRIKNKKR